MREKIDLGGQLGTPVRKSMMLQHGKAASPPSGEVPVKHREAESPRQPFEGLTFDLVAEKNKNVLRYRTVMSRLSAYTGLLSNRRQLVPNLAPPPQFFLALRKSIHPQSIMLHLFSPLPDIHL